VETGATPAQAKRRKRSTEQVRHQILTAAEELFSTRGYAGTTTKEIARAAETTEAAIFRAFTSKQELFNAAVLAPLEEFMAHYAQDWLPEPRRHGTPQEALRQFAEELYTVVIDHRQLFASLVANGLVGKDAQPVLARLEKVSDGVKHEHGLQWDTPIAARAMLGMVISMAMFEDVLYASGRRPSRKRIIDELTRILIGAAGLLPAGGKVGRRKLASTTDRSTAKPVHRKRIVSSSGDLRDHTTGGASKRGTP
jgi:AcrR family transcriptional regulator